MVSKQLPYNFMQGKAYMIKLNIGLTPIQFDAEVAEWGTSEDKDITWE